MLDAEVGNSTRADIFEQAHPDRYLPVGIAEQNMLGMAAGLAAAGFIPFPVTFAVFAVKRSRNPGFAGIDNELYFLDKTRMLFGDAKVVMGDLVKNLSEPSGMH